MGSTVVVLIVLTLVAVLTVAGLALRSWLQRWQDEVVANHREATDAAVRALQAERAASVSTAVDAVLAVAADKFGDQLNLGAEQLDRRTDQIGSQLKGMNEQLNRVNELVATLQKERAQQHGQLVSGLEEQTRRSAELASTTQSLREALSSPKARGQWGERMAEDVLRLAGMSEGINYRKQSAVAGGTIPDFTFLLPNGWTIHMDVKFPLDNYLKMLSAAAETDKAAHAAAFGRDVRDRIKELGTRGYIERGETLEYVLAFIPNEAVYSFVHEQNPALVDEALRQRVVLCSPFTLFAVLAVIRQWVDSVALERTSDEILTVLAGFSQQWDKFSDVIDGLGKKLETTTKAYEDLAGPRRRQLQRSLDRVDELRSRAGLDGAPFDAAEPAPLRAVGG
jgi:DNA recombination protein RmuC